MEFNGLRAKIPFSLSDRAVREIERLKMELGSDIFLRLGVRKKFQSKFGYFLSFDELEADDYRINVSGVDLIINASHVMYVSCVKIDFVNGVFKVFSGKQKKIVEWGSIENIYYP